LKPTVDITPELLDNAQDPVFKTSFFDRFHLRRAPRPLQLTDEIAKDYLFPTLYGDVLCAQAIFMCSYEKAARLMHHPRIKPVAMPRGRALVAFSCYIYRNVLGVAPYNEIAMTIPIMVDPRVNVPVLPMVLDRFPEFGFHVFSMPVTSLENQLRGLRIWGLPKVVQQIEIEERGGQCVTVAHEEDGARYFELRVPTSGKPTDFDVSANLYSTLDGRLLQSQTCFQGTFNVEKHMGLLLKKGAVPDEPSLILGDSPSAQPLKDLEIEAHPFQTRFCRSMSSCFDLANEGYRAPFDPGEASRSVSVPGACVGERLRDVEREIQQRTLPERPKIVFFGVGVIGGTVAGWLRPHYDRMALVDRGAIAEALRTRGITLYPGDTPAARSTVHVPVLDDLAQARDADVIVLGVKNYSLEPVARLIREELGDRPVIVAMQNGVENQAVLPRYFSKVIYCIVSYNAWADEPGVIGYQKKGPLVFGALDPTMAERTEALAALFNLGVETVTTDRIADAAHCKLVINLANSLTTLIGHMQRPISDAALFQKVLTSMTYEGMQIVKAAGYRESRLGGMPSWAILWAGAKLPRAVTKGLFAKNVKKMVLSSMAQDVHRGGGESELETINGYLLSLAERHGVPAPVNRTVYDICRREFARPDFASWDIRDVWREVEKAQG
jgi:2-dehydropantoate 2-reductase